MRFIKPKYLCSTQENPIEKTYSSSSLPYVQRMTSKQKQQRLQDSSREERFYDLVSRLGGIF